MLANAIETGNDRRSPLRNNNLGGQSLNAVCATKLYHYFQREWDVQDTPCFGKFERITNVKGLGRPRHEELAPASVLAPCNPVTFAITVLESGMSLMFGDMLLASDASLGDAKWKVHWQTKIASRVLNSFLILQHDSNLVHYGGLPGEQKQDNVLWDTATYALFTMHCQNEAHYHLFHNGTLAAFCERPDPRKEVRPFWKLTGDQRAVRARLIVSQNLGNVQVQVRRILDK
jgi:hypothetical protein